MSRKLWKMIAALAVTVLAVALAAMPAHAATIVESGTWGTCPWELTDEGTLTVYPGVGASQDERENSPWFYYRWDITSVCFNADGTNKVVAPANSSHLFVGLFNVGRMDLSGLDTSAVTNMCGMFAGCGDLYSLEQSFDTSKVTNMSSMFDECSDIVVLDISNFDTSHVTDMSCMFLGCISLTDLDISSFDTSNVTDMSEMFASCGIWSVGSFALDLGNFNTSNVTDMRAMFNTFGYRTALDLSGFDTANVTDMSEMFSHASLTTLDISGFNTANADTTDMFESMTRLDSFTVGTGFVPNAEGELSVPYGEWVASSDGQVYSGSELANRGVADTYTKAKPDLSRATIAAIPNQTYTGYDIEPSVTITLDGKTLSEGTDYSLSYENNKKAGIATVTATGMGNYAGTQTATFTIDKANIANAVISDIPDQVYTGGALHPSFTVTWNGMKLGPNDYSIVYSNNVDVGTALVTVEAYLYGSFFGEVTTTFNIVKEVKTGWQQDESGTWYFYDSEGKPMTNHWESYGGKWYYFGLDGALVWNGVCYYQGNYYYVKSGKVQTTKSGWKQINGDWYYFNGAYGAAYKNQWYVYGKSYYFLGKDGVLLVDDWVQYKGTWYHFNSKGVCDKVGLD